MSLFELRAAFKAGKITEQDYIDRMHERRLCLEGQKQ